MTKGFLTVPNAEARLVVKVFIPKHLVSLDSMKAIASMLCLVDPLLSDIHPAHCGPSSLYSLGLQYNSLARDDANDLQAEMLSAVEVEDPWNNRLSPDRKPLELLPRPGDLGETKYRHRIHRILGATSVQDLIHLMDIAIYGEEGRYPHASPAYCFLENKTTIAIEFNQHCGTLDMLETSLWAIFCVKLTQHCLDKSGTFFHESYPNLRYCSTICDFLEEQGLDSSLLTDRGEGLQKYVRNESYSFGIELELYTGTYIYRQWSERNVPADFEQYIPVDKAVDRRTLGIMKKLWTAETLQRLKLLITPSMGSKSCLGLSKCHSFDEFDEGSEDKCRGTVEFRYLEGKGDDHGFWINRIEIMSNLPLDAQQLARRPADDNEILPPLDNGYIDALRDELCTREMKLPCTIQKAATLNESESSTDPDDLAKLLSEKAGFFL
ncbi:hypothetical protein FOC4_g10011381 [Fusarium odoratissimum]|uniref:Uncharacterized protein n=1 Tax=Fusarium oxysporum f. sp. cubense (strain race 4) TaxID=2502994 RepID=N1RFK6_FUSC4|nr:hypothetical protein FOC4_g10011381 [Fusarium odoratissimum]